MYADDDPPESREERRRRKHREAVARYAEKNRDKVRAWSREYRVRKSRDPRWEMLRGARCRARAARLPFAITIDDIAIPKRCPVFGTPLVRGGMWVTPHNPSLDRIVPELGYVPGNIAVISHRANLIKSTGTAKEHRKIADWIDRVTLSRRPVDRRGRRR
ncbi:MAG: hypothetical protein ACO3EH_00340 [Ilumatobacteraceae bacterium]